MEENKKNKIWVYAVVLFTSAFIVLLFTAYSQIKLNKNLDEYKNQVYIKDSEKNKVQQNFSSAQEMNEKLNEEIKMLEEENSTLKNELANLKIENENVQLVIAKKDEEINDLSRAMTEYLKGNIVESATMLKNVDASLLDAKAADTYKTLTLKANAEAGKLLFDEGFSLYNKAKYIEAAGKLLLSSQFAPGETFSDKCLYYLAYAEIKSGNTKAALDHMNMLIQNYSSSKYMKSAKRFVEKYKQ